MTICHCPQRQYTEDSELKEYTNTISIDGPDDSNAFCLDNFNIFFHVNFFNSLYKQHKLYIDLTETLQKIELSKNYKVFPN